MPITTFYLDIFRVYLTGYASLADDVLICISIIKAVFLPLFYLDSVEYIFGNVAAVVSHTFDIVSDIDIQ